MHEIKNKIKKIEKQSGKIKEEIKERSLTYIIAAFGLVAGLAWNEAIKSLIEDIFPLGNNTLWAKFIYAIIITLIVVLATIYLNKIFRKKE